MEAKNDSIKQTLSLLFNKGKSEIEAYEELSKFYSPEVISLKLVNKWFKVFRSKDNDIGDKVTSSKEKLTDEFIIDLINKNPDLNMENLAKLANTSRKVISNRLKQINRGGERVEYSKKDTSKFTDEYLINLINENPELSMAKLAKLAGTSAVTISNRIKQINSNNERVKYVSKNYKQDSSKPIKKPRVKLTDEFLIDLINENLDLSMEKLAAITNTSHSTISRMIKGINNSGKLAIYQKKNTLKFTDEFLIDLINKNPDFSIEKLSELTNTSQKTISRRINQINSKGKKANYQKKDKPKFTNEFLTELINENSDLNMEKLAILANTTNATISRRLNQINKNGESVNYHKKRISNLTDDYIIDLVNKNHDLNMTELAKLSGISYSTISRRIKKINNSGERVYYNNKKCQKD